MTHVKRILKPTDLNNEQKETFNSDVVELLGFTKEYLNKTSGVKLPDSIHQLALEIALQSAKLNHLCTKFDKLLTQQKIIEVHRKQIEWAEMVSAKRAANAAKERLKLGKKLKGIDKKIYLKTGELPHEVENRLMEAFIQKMKEREAENG